MILLGSWVFLKSISALYYFMVLPLNCIYFTFAWILFSVCIDSIGDC